MARKLNIPPEVARELEQQAKNLPSRKNNVVLDKVAPPGSLKALQAITPTTQDTNLPDPPLPEPPVQDKSDTPRKKSGVLYPDEVISIHIRPMSHYSTARETVNSHEGVQKEREPKDS